MPPSLYLVQDMPNAKLIFYPDESEEGCWKGNLHS